MEDITAFKNSIKNILLIRRNNIGDMICTIPVFKTIRKEFPDAHITVLADSTNAGIIEGASFIDDLLVYKKGCGIYRNKYLNYWRLFQKNKRKFDIVIALKIGFSSTLALITLLSRARIRVGCIPEKWHLLKGCYNVPISGWKKWKSIHAINGFLELIKTIGIKNPIQDIGIEITSDSRNKAKDFLKETLMSQRNTKDNENYPFPIPLLQGEGVKERVVVFNISNNKPENRWPLCKFKELGDIICQKYNAIIIVTSTPSDMDEAMSLSGQIKGRIFYFHTPRVMDFAALVAESNLLICGEGGAMHIGASVSTPTISFWGSLRPRKWTPYGERQFVVKKGEHVDSISMEEIAEVIKNNNLLERNEKSFKK